MSQFSIPDLREFTKTVRDILKYVEAHQTMTNKELEREMDKNYPEFTNNYYTTMKKLISRDEDTPYIFTILKTLNEAKKGNLTDEDIAHRVNKEVLSKCIQPI